MQRFNIGDYVQTTRRKLDTRWHEQGTAGHITDCGRSDYDPDDFKTRQVSGRTEVYVYDALIEPGVWGDQWQDADDWLLSYGMRLADGSIIACDQNDLETAEDPIAERQLSLNY